MIFNNVAIHHHVQVLQTMDVVLWRFLIELVQSSGKLKVKSYVGCFEDCGADINFDGIYRPTKSK
jgi:hypothetical protein